MKMKLQNGSAFASVHDDSVITSYDQILDSKFLKTTKVINVCSL